MKLKIVLPAIALIAVTVSAAVALLLFTQNFPQVSRPSGILANCETLEVIGNPITASLGIGGFLNFGCSGGPAFQTIGLVTATPTFTLPEGYILISVQIDLECSGAGTTLTSGSSVTLTANSYYYCGALDSFTPTLAPFSVSWNVP